MDNIQRHFNQFYFFYCALFTIHAIFLPVICHALGFSASEIGYIALGGTILGIIAPPLLQYLTRYWLSERNAIRLCLLFTCLLFLVLSQTTVYLWFALTWALYQLCSRLSVFIDAKAIELTTLRKISFEHARVWGSISFILVALIIGYLLDYYSTAVIFIIGAVLLLGVLGSTWKLLPLLPDQASARMGQLEPVKAKTLLVISPLLILVFLNSLSHAPLYLYWPLYLSDLGWSKATISLGWGISIAFEVVLFTMIPRFLTNPSRLVQLLTVSTILTTLRWIVVYLSTDTVLLLASQSLHAFSFAGIYIGSTRLIYYLLPPGQKHLGQGYLQALGAGAGLAAGQLLFSQKISAAEGYLATNDLFGISAIFALSALLICFLVHLVTQKICKRSQQISS